MDGFYAKLTGVLAGMDFAGRIQRIGAPQYKGDGLAAGRPPIDPAVPLKILMVGFLEGIGSGRSIAARCADSLIIRRFLGYALTEETRDYSGLGVFRQRLLEEFFAAAHEVVLEGLRRHGPSMNLSASGSLCATGPLLAPESLARGLNKSSGEVEKFSA